MRAIREVIDNMDVKLSQVLLETVIVQIELGDELQTGIDWVQRGRQRETFSRQLTDQYGRNLYWNEEGDTMIATTEKSDYPVMEYFTDVRRDGFVNNNNYMLGGGGGSGVSSLGSLM